MATPAGRVVVIGAGPAGSTIAYILATKGREVVIVDPGKGSTDRVEMLPPNAMAAFATAGFGALLDEPSLSVPCLGVVRGDHREEFIGRPGGRGAAIDRARFDARLRSYAVAGGAELRRARLVSAAARLEHVDLMLTGPSGQETLSTQTVVDATGRAAGVGRRLGATLTTFERRTATPTIWPEPIGPWLAFAAQGNGWRYAITGPGGRVDAWRVESQPRAVRIHGAVDASARRLAPAAGAMLQPHLIRSAVRVWLTQQGAPSSPAG